VFARDVMALEHVVNQLDGLLEQADRLGVGDGDADKSGHVLAQPPRIDRGVVPHDDPAVLELLDPLYDRRRRQPHLLAKLDVRDPAVFLQN